MIFSHTIIFKFTHKSMPISHTNSRNFHTHFFPSSHTNLCKFLTHIFFQVRTQINANFTHHSLQIHTQNVSNFTHKSTQISHTNILPFHTPLFANPHKHSHNFHIFFTQNQKNTFDKFTHILFPSLHKNPCQIRTRSSSKAATAKTRRLYKGL